LVTTYDLQPVESNICVDGRSGQVVTLGFAWMEFPSSIMLFSFNRHTIHLLYIIQLI